MRRTIAAAAVAFLVVACGASEPDNGEAALTESSEPDGGDLGDEADGDDVDPDDAGDAGDDDAPSDDPQEEAGSGPFRMEVLDSFSITDRDEPLVTGRVAGGTVAVGDALCLDGTAVTVAGIEAFREVRETASAGEDVGILLGGIELDAIQDGMVLEPC